jgi:UDP-N-acetylmuramoyl-L-alanyl-D-glutamate--2,6-diaminopimelate ligase
VPGRMEIVSKEPLVIVDFAHTPDGMEKVLSSVEGKKVVVFGAGGNRDRDKRHLMGEVASKWADFIFVTNDNPRCEEPEEIAKDIIKGINKPYKMILDRKKAICEALNYAKENNAVLFILGKGDENYIEYCNKRVDYSDREVVLECLEKL